MEKLTCWAAGTTLLVWAIFLFFKAVFHPTGTDFILIFPIMVLVAFCLGLMLLIMEMAGVNEEGSSSSPAFAAAAALAASAVFAAFAVISESKVPSEAIVYMFVCGLCVLATGCLSCLCNFELAKEAKKPRWLTFLPIAMEFAMIVAPALFYYRGIIS